MDIVSIDLCYYHKSCMLYLMCIQHHALLLMDIQPKLRGGGGGGLP